MFTANQVRTITEMYGYFPRRDVQYGDPIAFRPPLAGEYYLSSVDHAFIKSMTDMKGCRLVYPELPIKYRFICDDPTPRQAEPGDWIVDNKDYTWPNLSGYGYDFIKSNCHTGSKFLIFRREEVPA